jgi:quercetin dioxygenase-like cupin family protein
VRIFRVSDIYPEPEGIPPHFDGITRLTHLPGVTVAGLEKIATVSHRDGAQTVWHSHPAGQVLVTLSGSARISVQGEEPVLLSQGDIVVADPGEVHRHGAAPSRNCVFVVFFGGATAWIDD